MSIKRNYISITCPACGFSKLSFITCNKTKKIFLFCDEEFHIFYPRKFEEPVFERKCPFCGEDVSNRTHIKYSTKKEIYNVGYWDLVEDDFPIIEYLNYPIGYSIAYLHSNIRDWGVVEKIPEIDFRLMILALDYFRIVKDRHGIVEMHTFLKEYNHPQKITRKDLYQINIQRKRELNKKESSLISYLFHLNKLEILDSISEEENKKVYNEVDEVRKNGNVILLIDYTKKMDKMKIPYNPDIDKQMVHDSLLHERKEKQGIRLKRCYSWLQFFGFPFDMPKEDKKIIEESRKRELDKAKNRSIQDRKEGINAINERRKGYV